MLAKIHQVRRIRDPFSYNERKVTEGKAECILAIHYLKDAPALTAAERLKRLEDLASLNDRVFKKGLHVSLNFHPKDDLSGQKLEQIIALYLEKTGCADQPWLVYRHDDAAHPHVHLVASTIRKDGTRMDKERLFLLSPKVCDEIENRFGLKKPGGTRPSVPLTLPQARRLEYGRTGTFAGIEGVVGAVVEGYCYGSLEELNALLLLYRVRAVTLAPTVENSREGLMYQMLDSSGRRTGIPIAARSMEGKPSLEKLEQHFTKNKEQKASRTAGFQARLGWVMVQPPHGFHELAARLHQEQIHTVISGPSAQDGYRFFFIDQQTRTVFGDAELQPGFRGIDLLERCGMKEGLRPDSRALTPGRLFDPSDHTQQPQDEEILLRTPDQFAPPPTRLQILPQNRHPRIVASLG